MHWTAKKITLLLLFVLFSAQTAVPPPAQPAETPQPQPVQPVKVKTPTAFTVKVPGGFTFQYNPGQVARAGESVKEPALIKALVWKKNQTSPPVPTSLNLEAFTNLEVLVVQGVAIQPGGLPKSLHYLYIEDSSLSAYELTEDNCRNLRYLDLSYNQIESIQISCPHLEVLKLTGNRLTSIELETVKLVYLDLGYNRLEDLPPLPPALRHLLLHYNGLSLIVEGSLPGGLITLNLWHNHFTTLPDLSSLPLVGLTLSGNCLGELPPLNWSTLERLYATGACIESLPPEVFKAERLRYLYLNDNLIWGLSDKPEERVELDEFSFATNPMNNEDLSWFNSWPVRRNDKQD